MNRSLHFVFRAVGSQLPFSERDACVYFWNHLRARLEHCLAFCLMPNHGHLIVEEKDGSQAKKALRLTLLAFQRKFPSLWEPTPEPAVIPDLKHLQRQVRYVHLNPCRSRLTRDPLCWEFSTHWDYLGLTVGSFSVPPVRVLGFSSDAKFHQYVSSDLTAQIGGTPMPARASVKNEFPLVSLDRVAELSVALTRSPCLESRVARQLFYSLASAAGYRNKTWIAKYLKITPQSAAQFIKRGRAFPYAEEMARQMLIDLRVGFTKTLRN